FFFFSSRRRHTRFDCDWSSDVCSSDLDVVIAGHQQTTREWWDTRRQSYELCVSQLVLDEAAGGDAQAAQERLLVLQPMLVLETRSEERRVGKECRCWREWWR